MSKQVVLKNITSLGLVQVANYVFPLITAPIISRIIGPDKFGVINYASAFVSYFTLLIAFGFDFTATRRITKNINDTHLRSKVFSEVLIAQCLLFLVSIVIFIVSLYYIPPIAAEKKVAVFTFILTLGSLLTQNWLFQAMQDLSKIALFNFISKLLFTISVLAVVKQKEDYIWQPLLISISQVLTAAISFYWAFKKYKLTFISSKLITILRLLWTEKTVFLSFVVINLYTTTNTVMLGLMRTEVQVGYYTAAQKLMAVAISIINFPIVQALYPFIGKSLAHSREKGIETIQKIIPFIMIITVFVGVSMFLFGPTILLLFYGSQFSPAIPAFRILAFVPAIGALSNVFGLQLMLNFKMDKAFFSITSVGALIGLILNYILINKIGYIGTAWNSLIVETYITVAMYLFLKRKGIETIKLKHFRLNNLRLQLKPVAKP